MKLYFATTENGICIIESICLLMVFLLFLVTYLSCLCSLSGLLICWCQDMHEETKKQLVKSVKTSLILAGISGILIVLFSMK